MIFYYYFSEVQRETQHSGDLRDESVAGGEAPGYRGLGRGGQTRDGLAALRGQSGGRDDERSRSFQVRNARETGRRGWLRLGLLRVQISHTLQRQVWLVFEEYICIYKTLA